MPAQLSQVTEVGVGRDVRIMLTGWDVWPGSVTLRLGVFLRTIQEGGAGRPVHWGGGRGGAGALCFGLLLADGRRVTTLDGNPWPAPTEGPPRPTLQLRGGAGGGFHYAIQLHLSQLPPAGPTQLVVEWPDKGVPETRTAIDATALRDTGRRRRGDLAGAGGGAQAAEERNCPVGEERSAKDFLTVSSGPSEIMATPATVAIVDPAKCLGHCHYDGGRRYRTAARCSPEGRDARACRGAFLSQSRPASTIRRRNAAYALRDFVLEQQERSAEHAGAAGRGRGSRDRRPVPRRSRHPVRGCFQLTAQPCVPGARAGHRRV